MGNTIDILSKSFLELQAKLHRSAMAILRNKMDAEDAVQEAFARLAAGKVMGSEAEALGKLYRTMKNACTDMLRERSRFSDETMKESGADMLFDETDTLKDLILKELPPLQRRVLEMAVLDGLEYQDIAKSLGTTVEAVRMNMMRARKRIRAAYNKLSK